MIPPISRTPTPAAPPEPPAGAGSDAAGKTEEGFGFGELLDILNPLHHLPGISTLYQKFSGDEIGNGARVIGGTLFGGLFGGVGFLAGMAASSANVALREVTGKDVGEHLFAFAASDPRSPPAPEFAQPPKNLPEGLPSLAEEIAEEEALQAAAASSSAPPGRTPEEPLRQGENRRLAMERYHRTIADPLPDDAVLDRKG
ncbi:MAG: hypothetical protein HQL51_02875 [Magnetococcales bacterium]|nr:hypothetical protein [Magnetococcales bacterium]